MTTLDGVTASVTVAGTLNNAMDLGVIATAPLSYSANVGFSSGVGANQADKIFADTRTITASSNDDLDLAGVLVDAFGAVITMARIRGLFVKAYAANTNNLIIGGGASNPITTILGGTTPTLTIRPGGWLGLLAPDAIGYVVTAATADILRFSNGGAGSSVTYDVVILGASA
jgi:hypothetical protein